MHDSTKVSPGEATKLSAHTLFSGQDAGGLHNAIRFVTGNSHSVDGGLRDGLRGVVSGLQLKDMGLVSIRYSMPLLITSRATRRRILVVIPRGPMKVTSGPFEWFSDAPFAMGTDHHTRVVPTPGIGALVIALDAEVVEETLESRTGHRFTGPLRLAAERRPLLLSSPELVQSACVEVCRELNDSGRGGPVELLSGHLLTAVTIGLMPLTQESLVDQGGAMRQHAESARSYIDRHLGETLSTRELARACGVSERTLHGAFVQELGTTPARYVREARLDRAHALLADERSPASSVAGVARRVGINHVGRFAGMYADRFGENPSATLARAQESTTEIA